MTTKTENFDLTKTGNLDSDKVKHLVEVHNMRRGSCPQCQENGCERCGFEGFGAVLDRPDGCDDPKCCLLKPS